MGTMLEERIPVLKINQNKTLPLWPKPEIAAPSRVEAALCVAADLILLGYLVFISRMLLNLKGFRSFQDLLGLHIYEHTRTHPHTHTHPT